MAELVANRRQSHFLMLGLFLITGAVFRDVLSAGFVRWDDGLHVYANPYLHPVSSANLAHFWTTPYQNLYIPLSYTLYSLLAMIAHRAAPLPTVDGLWVDLDPRVFHAAGLLLHSVNVLLVFTLLRRLLPHRDGEGRTAANDGAACAGALLFAVHPLQVEAVAWIAEIRGLLAGVFSLCALQAWLKVLDTSQKGRWYVLATLCFALALLSKPSAVALPLMAAVLAGWRAAPARTWLPGLAGWGAFSLFMLLVTHGAQPVTMDLVTPLWMRPLVAADALVFDLGKLLCPTHLGIDYGRGPLWLRAHGNGYGAGAMVAALGVGLWTLRRRCPALLTGTGLFAAALLPTLGLTPFAFQVYSTVADRYLYLALLGPAFLLASGLSQIGDSALTRLRLTAFSACGLALLGCALRTTVQARTWNNSISLFTQALDVNPQSWVACNNLGAVALNLGHPLDALPLLAEAVRLRPGYAEAHANRGVALLLLGARPDAEREFRTAARLKPDYPRAYSGLGDALLAQGRAEDAAAAFRQALALEPGQPQVRAALQLAERTASAP